MSDEKKKVEKIEPSILERAVEKLLYKTLGDRIPDGITPNMLTLFGGIGSLIGIICAALAPLCIYTLIGTIAGLVCHVICDDLDGYVARKKNMGSNSGAYFDLLTDILNITFLIIALAFAGIVKFQIAIFLVPVYALIIFTSMNEILYVSKFTFPTVGPIETHLFFIAICVGTMITGIRPVVTIKGIGLSLADIIFIVGAIPMYFEMIRLQIKVFLNIKEKDNERNK
ncbi:MAG: CDP-alcohol phosphatidyltransferase family protein [Lachnospiraceae bacterium]|nr:CDP-alcohol phosphatidyltransferase family protein [Lachnospiraceae bacterium]